MNDMQRKKAHKLLEDRGVSRALFAHKDSVAWLTGFAPPVQLGSHLFAGGPPLVWVEEGHFTLFVVDAYLDSVLQFGDQPGCSVVSYPGYTYRTPPAGHQELLNCMQPVVTRADRSGGVGIEAQSTPYMISSKLLAPFADRGAVVPIDGWLEPLRMVKTSAELAVLRENFALADVGQAAARRAVTAGKREIDIWTEAHSAIQKAAGCRVPLGNDCVVGSRALNFTGWPQDYEIKQDESIIVDLGTGLHGYWSDGCATYYANEPTTKQIAMHRTVMDALELAISMVRPGQKVREIDLKVRDLIEKAGFPVYPHHTGHGVGVSSHEAPRIVPYSDEVLEEGMVIMLEPGIYLPGETGVRLEDGVLVTARGAEILTRHDKSLP